MSEWNAMTYEGKDTILRVVRTEAERMFAMADQPEAWYRPTACPGWETRDVVAHIVDTVEGYFAGFDAARGGAPVPDALGLAVMSEKVDEGASALRDIPQAELMGRLKADFEKLQGMLAPMSADEWTGFIVTHKYMGPVPAFFYAAGQLMDYGVHSWDIRQGTGRARGNRPQQPRRRDVQHARGVDRQEGGARSRALTRSSDAARLAPARCPSLSPRLPRLIACTLRPGTSGRTCQSL
jgi:uncharacterized protein (TIGR03083 family)